MSVKDLYKVINVYDSLNASLLFSINYDDFHDFNSAETYFSEKVINFLEEGREVFIKFGYKN